MANKFFEIEQPVHNGSTWEPIENSRVETMEEAQSIMEHLEAELGWTGMRIVEVVDA